MPSDTRGSHLDDESFGYTLSPTGQREKEPPTEEKYGFSFSIFKFVIGTAFFLAFFGSHLDWIFLISLAIAILCHEAGHVIAGKTFGCHIKEMQVFLFSFLSYQPKPKAGGSSWRQIKWSLGALPLGGVTIFKSRQAGAESEAGVIQPVDAASSPYIDDKPAWQRLIISAAGILVNIAMFVILYYVTPSFIPTHWWQLNDSIAFVSLILAVLNILPVYPLDGGAMVFALFEMLTGRKPSASFTRNCGTIGFVIIILFFWVFPGWINRLLESVFQIIF